VGFGIADEGCNIMIGKKRVREDFRWGETRRENLVVGGKKSPRTYGRSLMPWHE